MARDSRGRPAVVRRPSAVTALLVVVGIAGLATRFGLTGVALPVPPTDPSVQVLTALSGTVLIGGVLNHLLVGERALPLTVTESTAAAAADAVDRLIADRGLSAARVYVPGTDRRGPRLVVPATGDDPVDSARTAVASSSTDAAVVTPTGAGLVARFREYRSEATATDPEHHADALCDALTAAFDLADSASATVADGEATVTVGGCPLGEPRRTDHPVVSVLGAGLAETLGTPVEVTGVELAKDGDFTVSVRWTT